MKRFLESSRYLAIVGIVSLLLVSGAAFFWGAVKTFKAIFIMITSYGQDPFIAVSLIELVDNFLIATALFVFAVSMYQLFLGRLTLPDWMLAHNLYEIKDKLGGVIILVMVLKFLEHLVDWKDPHDSLLFAISVALVSAALIALSYLSGRE
jgi:uncharacterized membrane protein YqhA